MKIHCPHCNKEIENYELFGWKEIRSDRHHGIFNAVCPICKGNLEVEEFYSIDLIVVGKLI